MNTVLSLARTSIRIWIEGNKPSALAQSTTRGAGRLFSACWVWLAMACSGATPGPSPIELPPQVAERPASPDATLDQAVPEPILFPYSSVDEAAAMKTLESAGASFDELVPSTWRAAIRDRLGRQVAAIEQSDSNAGVGIRGNSHRLFNVALLERGHFELIGLTYRAERIPFDPERCGDVRLIYRLAYRSDVSGTIVHSRLPMTVLVELAAAERSAGSCRQEAARWLSPKPLEGAALARFLLEGPLRDRVQAAQIQQVLINAQIVRWPSAVRPTLGGHAEYSMLAFAPNAEDRSRLETGPLENTIDVQRLKRDRKLRSELLAWIDQNLAGIDSGIAIMPDRFLASEAISVTPRGLSRRANRPARQLFQRADFERMDLAGLRRVSSPEALLRRLDDMSCVGCHQSRTIAGFHWLGVDDDTVAPGNSLFVSRSVPLLGDVRRRDQYVVDVAADRVPDFSRPFAERDDAEPGIVGSRCGLGDLGFTSWTCAEGLVCDPYDAPSDDRIIGTCTSEGAPGPGEACEFVALSPDANPHRDRARNASERSCADGVCNINRTGFPGGMCTSSCSDLPSEGVCGVIARLTPFNNCLARKTPFPRCLAEHVAPAGLRACDEERPCRDDYVCAKTPGGEGGCIPPYFLFQLRVDGHP